MKRITSRANPFYKTLLKLAHSSRERKKSNLTLLDGAHLIAAYREHIGAPQSLIVSDSGVDNSEIKLMLDEAHAHEALMLPDALFAEISAVTADVGIVALIPTPASVAPEHNADFCILLDGIQDPGNLGSILRSAAAAGVSDVLLSKQCAFVWSPRVLRAGMGAHFMLKLHEHADLLDYAVRFEGKIIAACARAEKTIFEIDLSGKIALLIGNEGAGISEALLQIVSERAAIPMPGKTESLNAAAAAAICLFERVRQTRKVKRSETRIMQPAPDYDPG